MSPTRPPSLMPPAPNSVAARAKVAADAVETLAEAGSQQANPSPRHSPKPPRTQETTADANARKAAAKAADIESAKEIVWSVLSLKMCDPTESWFENVDEDGDGTIDRMEFRNEIDSYRMGVPTSIINAIFDDLDTDGSGAIDYEEYMRFVLKETLQRKARITMCMLWKMDEDRSGTIDRMEFRKAVAAVGPRGASTELIDELFDQVDLDGNGHLTIEEINHFLNHGCKAPDKGVHLGLNQALRTSLLNEAGPRRLRSMSTPMRRSTRAVSPVTNYSQWAPTQTPTPPSTGGSPRPPTEPKPPPSGPGLWSETPSSKPVRPPRPASAKRGGFVKFDTRAGGAVDVSDGAADGPLVSPRSHGAAVSLPMLRPPAQQKSKPMPESHASNGFIPRMPRDSTLHPHYNVYAVR